MSREIRLTFDEWNNIGKSVNSDDTPIGIAELGETDNPTRMELFDAKMDAVWDRWDGGEISNDDLVKQLDQIQY